MEKYQKCKEFFILSDSVAGISLAMILEKNRHITKDF
jgi:hypothetical protein